MSPFSHPHLMILERAKTSVPKLQRASLRGVTGLGPCSTERAMQVCKKPFNLVRVQNESSSLTIKNLDEICLYFIASAQVNTLTLYHDPYPHTQKKYIYIYTYTLQLKKKKLFQNMVLYFSLHNALHFFPLFKSTKLMIFFT